MEGQDGDSERSSVDFAFLDGSKVTLSTRVYLGSHADDACCQILSDRHIFSAVYAALLAASAQTLRTATIVRR